MMENRNLGSPDTVILHVGTNDLKRTVNLDYVMGEVYALVNKAKDKFPQIKNGTKWSTAEGRCVMVAYRSIERQM